MMAQQSGATVEMALLEPNKAQPQNQVAPKKDKTPGESVGNTEEFQMLGKDGLTFWDFLDIVNPLQHIPVISTVYRAITGDEIDPAAKIAGSTLYGGPLGAISSLIDVAVDFSTGKDIGEHAMAFLQEDAPAKTETALMAAPSTARSIGANHTQNPYLARAGAGELPVAIASFAPPSPVLAQEIGQRPAFGMTGIPIAKQSYMDQIAAYRPKSSAKSAPDLGLLSDIKSLEQAGIIDKQSAPLAPLKTANAQPYLKPMDLSPRYSADLPKNSIELNARLKKAETAYQKLSATNNSWLIDSIMNGMEGLDKMTPRSLTPRPLAPKVEISARLY